MPTILKKIGQETVHTGSIGTVGAKNNAQTQLADSDFPTPASAAYFHFYGNLTNSGQDSGSFDGGTGAPKYDTKAFYGNENAIRFESSDAGDTGGGDSISSSSDFGNTSLFTSGIWMFKPRWHLNGNGTVFGKWDDDSGGQRSWFVNTNTGGVSFRHSTDGNNNLGGTLPIFFEDNTWHHFAVRHDGTNFELWIDGQLAQTEAPGAISATSEAFRINAQGTNVNDLVKQRVNCSAQEFYYYDGVLTDDEMISIYSKRFENKQLAGGHTLAPDSLPFDSLGGKALLWTLDGTNTRFDVSGNSIDLDEVSALPYDGLDLNGLENSGKTDSAAYWRSDNAFFSGLKTFSSVFAFGGWVAADDWNSPSGVDALFSLSEFSTGDEVCNIGINTSGEIQITDKGATSCYPNSFANGSWHHVAMRAVGGVYYLYVDGVNVLTHQTATERTSDRFAIGSFTYAGANLINGRFQNAFFVKNAPLADADIRKLAAATISITNAADADDQSWQALYEREDGHIKGQVADGWLVDRTSSKIYVDFGGSPGDKVTLKLSRGK